MEAKAGGYRHASLKLKTVVLFCMIGFIEEKGRESIRFTWARERILFTGQILLH